MSTLWPPNALLLAALLLSPTRWWWALLLAALPAHLAAELGLGIPLPMVLSWFVSNSTEALLGAGGVRLLHRGPFRLDSFRQVMVFVFAAALVAPFLSSFLDAGLVALNRFGEGGFWQVWSSRLLSSAVAALTVATVVVTLGGAGVAALRPSSWRRVLEASAMTLGLLAACVAVFATYPTGMQPSPALVYAPLPFLLWAAVRFGPVGISGGLLACALISIWGATRGLGPFLGGSPPVDAMSLQLFIIISAVPLLTLAAVIQERGRAEHRARRNMERVTLALRAARMGAWEWRTRAARGSLSAHARRVLGMTASSDAVTPAGLLRAVVPEDRPLLRRLIRGPLKPGGLYEAEFRVRKRSGAVRWVRGSALVHADRAGAPTRVLGVAADITERKLTLQAVEESERRFRGVFETRLAPMAFLQADGRITDANDAYLRLTGFTRAELAAGELRWDRMTAPEYRHLDIRAFQDLRDHGRCAPYEKEYLLRDGRRIPVQVGLELLGPDRGISVEVDLSSRKRAERELETRLRFERLVSDLSATFATRRDTRSEDQIPLWLGRLGEFLDVQWVRVTRLTAEHPTLRLAFAWTAEGQLPLPETLCTREIAVVGSRLIEGRTVAIEDCGQPPPASEIEGALLTRLGSGALLAIPLVASGRVIGALTFVSVRPRPWSQDLVQRLRLIADIFSNAMARKALEAGRRQAEAVNTAILASLPGMMAILDRNGRIVRVNDAWARRDEDHRIVFDLVGLDDNMLVACRRACAGGDRLAKQVLAGLEAVLAGARRDVSLTYSVPASDGDAKWYDMQIQRLSRREGGAVVTRLDCTARRRAELEAARNRAELAHVVRVATMGELAASLAHELSQPLTAIRSNAQAGSRMLASTDHSVEAIEEILSDIIANDRRASEILTRIWNLVRKGELELSPVDLNGIIREVSRLVETDALLRGVTTSLELEDGIPSVHGDRIQLQQVVLNLILNGLDAMAALDQVHRHLTIRTVTTAPGTVQVGVRDTGPGIPCDRLQRVFEPFYTSKPDGLGMGLSIARSIVRAHGGRMWAENHPAGGACVGFDLPVAVRAR